MLFEKKTNIKANIKIPGDKSISHRAVILSSISLGKSTITGLLEAEDVLNTIEAMRLCGVNITRLGDGHYEVIGLGNGGLLEPKNIIDMGNSGTACRLIAGLLSSYDFTSFFYGDESLTKRPMQRIIDPLEQNGSKFITRSKGRCPMAVVGSSDPVAITYELPMASAQVKSAVLLAGLNTRGVTTIIEKEPTRNHTEIMLKKLGHDIKIEEFKDGEETKREITLEGMRQVDATDWQVPSDPSSAAFFAALAVITQGSKITINNICMNKTRNGFYEVLERMGANIKFNNKREQCGEEVCDIEVSYSPDIKAIDLEEEIAVRLIDEYLILSVVCAFANGKSILRGLKELTVKESDRLKAIEDGLKAIGVERSINYNNFSITIEGNGGKEFEGTGEKKTIKTLHDHRIAMSFIIAGMNSKNGVKIDSLDAIATSFPNFLELIKS